MTELLPVPDAQSLPGGFNSLEDLYSRYGSQAYGLALRMLENETAAEQAIQEVFLRYWRQPGLYNPQNGSFLNWLLREVHSYCLGRIPAKGRAVQSSGRAGGPLTTSILGDNHPGLTETIREAGTNYRQQNKAREALAALPTEQRDILELAFFKGLNHQQIAQVTGHPAQTVRQQLTLGLVRLKHGMA